MNSLTRFALVMLFAILFTPNSRSDEKIGLALSGGGARGAAHIGVLRELERQQIPIDYIAGTSMGAIVGGLYASGKSVNDIEALLTEIDWSIMFSDSTDRRDLSIRRKLDEDVFQINKKAGIDSDGIGLPSGVILGQNLQLLLNRLFLDSAGIRNFDELPIPFRAVATDISTGRMVALGNGDLARAVKASMSVPSIFSTVEIDGQILVDGGISNNMPVDVVKEMGADIVIAVDIGTTLQSADKLDSVLGVSIQLTNLLVRNTTEQQIANLTPRDVLIVPDLGDYSSSNFTDSFQIVDDGETATAAMADQLARFTTGETRSPIAYPDPKLLIITRLDFNNNSDISDDYLRARISQAIGEPLDIDQLERDISVIYGIGSFETVSYEVVEAAGGTTLRIDVVEKPWGPNYLQFGLSYSSNFGSADRLSARFGLTVTPLNSLNSEWRTIVDIGDEPGLFTEFYQPIGSDSSWFAVAGLYHENSLYNTFVNNELINQIDSQSTGGTLALGREIEQWGDLRFGLDRFSAKNDIEIGNPDESVEDYEGGELFGQLVADSLDSLYFPKSGGKGLLKLISSREAYGADNEFDQVLVDGMTAHTFGENTLIGGARFFSTVSGEAPLQSEFRLGGLFNLPGFTSNELNGQHLYLLRGFYYRKLHHFPGLAPYLSLSLQFGNTFDEKDDISTSNGILGSAVSLGWDTIIGPVYLGYGLAESGHQSFYLTIGSSY